MLFFKTVIIKAVNPLPEHTAYDKIVPVLMSLDMLRHQILFGKHVAVMENQNIASGIADRLIPAVSDPSVFFNSYKNQRKIRAE